jgi:hypothetical protein
MLKFSRQARLAPRRMRSGLTLVEMLVAMTCTLLMMLAITQTFQNIGDVSAKGRAAIELSTQLRGVQHRLHKDLESLTVPVRPWPEAGAGEGYFEIYEGPLHDLSTTQNGQNDLYGDIDDILAMTIRSTGEPFVGMYNGQMIQSQVAEVIWFMSFVDKDGDDLFTPGTDPLSLHRRVLLVRPDLNDEITGELVGVPNSEMFNFLQSNDVSVRYGSSNLACNSLADLTQRENRFAHDPSAFPHPIIVQAPSGFFAYTDASGTTRGYALSGARAGEDVILSSVLAADIRVFDRQAIVRASSDGTEAVAPGDPGWPTGGGVVGYGAFVDLLHGAKVSGSTGDFALGPAAKSRFSIGTGVYDTWSYYYEHDGDDQDGVFGVDQGTNGIDDDDANGVDDVGERETSPPYPVPLRGVQVRVRVLEPETRQVRQATVVKDFLPE